MNPTAGDSLGAESRAGVEDATPEDLEEILDDPHCRYLLEYLEQEAGAVGEERLARHVVSEITRTPPESINADVHRRVQTWLHHGQLPILDEYGVVEFDANDGEVRLGRDEEA